MIESDEALQVRVLAAMGAGLGSIEAQMLQHTKGKHLDTVANGLGLWRDCPLQALERLAYGLVVPAAVASIVQRLEALNPDASVPREIDGENVRFTFIVGHHESEDTLRTSQLRHDPDRYCDGLFEGNVAYLGERLIREWLPAGDTDAEAAHRRARDAEQEVRRLERELAGAMAAQVRAEAQAAEHKARGAQWCAERDEARRELEAERVKR